MTTRVLQAFDTLDNHSMSTLERFAKKNHQLTQAPTNCFAYGRYTGLGLHHEFSARKKPKANKEIIRDEQTLLYKRLKKSLAVTASSSKSSKSVEAGSGRVIIDPENTTNVKPSTGHAGCGGKEEVGISFWTMPKEPQTLRLYSRSPCRMIWSREVEKVPSLQELTKVNRSKALLGITLGDSGICHWCSHSIHCEVAAPFKSPVPDEWLNTQQPQENIENISTGTSLPHNMTEKEVCAEPVPLNYDDLLKGKDVKVLAPRLYQTFLSDQKSSESYPATYSSLQHQYEPFSSPGLHPVEPPPQTRKRSLFSAIVLYKEDMQTKYMIRRMRERQTAEDLGSHRPYSQPELKEKKSGVNCVNMRVLTADGKLISSPDLTRLPFHYHDETPAVCASKPSQKILIIPKRTVLSPCVGPVINGMNPRQICESGKISPACCKPPPPSPRRGLSLHSAHRLTPQSRQASSRNRMDFLSISRPLKCSENGVNCIIREKQFQNEDWQNLANEQHKTAMAEVTDCEETADVELVSTCSTADSEKSQKHNALSWHPGLINIPTADILN